MDALINDESFTYAAGKGVAGLFIKPIGAISRLVSDTGRSLLSFSDQQFVHWEQFLKEKPSPDLFYYFTGEDVVQLHPCAYLDSKSCFILLTKSSIQIIDANQLIAHKIWQVCHLICHILYVA